MVNFRIRRSENNHSIRRILEKWSLGSGGLVGMHSVYPRKLPVIRLGSGGLVGMYSVYPWKLPVMRLGSGGHRCAGGKYR